MFKVELTKEEINIIGKYIDIGLKQFGISELKSAFVILTKLENAAPIDTPKSEIKESASKSNTKD